MDYINSLPLEIQLDIFSRVPAESLLNNSKLVCKTWNDLVHHPSLPQLHLHHINHDDYGKLGFLASIGCVDTQKFKYFEYNQNKDTIGRIRRVNIKTPFYSIYSCPKIVGSCNGLICLEELQSLCIYNPITREQVMLPKIQFSGTGKYSSWTSGFGYLPSTDEYKIVGIQASYFLPKIAEVHIYTLGSGTGWRNLGTVNIDFGPNLPIESVFANGTLYWIREDSKMIITFDLAKEKFCEHLSTPPFARNSNQIMNGKLGVLDGFLYFYVWMDEEDDLCCDIWLLENKKLEDLRSLGCSWTKMFKLEDFGLVAVTKSGGVLTHGWDYHLKIYDRKTCISRKLVDFKEPIREIFPHKNTLVSLKQLGEEGIEMMESIEIDRTKCCDSPLEHLEDVEALDRVSKKGLVSRDRSKADELALASKA